MPWGRQGQVLQESSHLEGIRALHRKTQISGQGLLLPNCKGLG